MMALNESLHLTKGMAKEGKEKKLHRFDDGP